MLNGYDSKECYDEIITATGEARLESSDLLQFFSEVPHRELLARARAAELAIREMGVSFSVYSDDSEKVDVDRNWQLDIIPRTIEAKVWREVDGGLKQRCRAINLFIQDVYNDKAILKDNVVPRELVVRSPNYIKECLGVTPSLGAWAHVCGTDLVRDRDGVFRVLEDNLRIPSGISYMLENREIIKRVIPEIFQNYNIDPVDDYPSQLHRVLKSLAPRQNPKPVIVVLTPGIYNSAYFEHAFLARTMGVELVEGQDLFVTKDHKVFMKTVDGAERVDVVYRRIDEMFLDPEVFRSDSTIGVPGLMRAWQNKQVAIANAPGSGVADDKALYSFVPDIIRYYLNEDPKLPSIRTYKCTQPEELAYILDNINDLVIKPVNQSGGKGLFIGPNAEEAEVKIYRKLITSEPRYYIAQPTIMLSTSPTFVDGLIEPRHLDLRPFVLTGTDSWVTSGGLTRVALKKGSLVVNSSKGGGSKDTWIVNERI
ncbi:MAG: hypothetical protein CMK29_08365 [Porticoccaceae bacterium]|nr:hypothetical protein [Porticoccaceae bacterium]